MSTGEARWLSASSTGEIAVIDASDNSVLTYIDRTLNGDPHTPYQVTIDEAQNLIYVGAKSLKPDPYALNGSPYGCVAIRELPSLDLEHRV